MRGMSVVTGLAVLMSAVVGMAQADVLAGGKLDGPAREKALQLFSATPAAFIENTGQIDDPTIRYAFYGSGANVFHTTSGPVFQVFQRDAQIGADFASPRANRPPLASAQDPAFTARGLVFRATFPGARQIRPTGLELLETKINYCLGADHGKWRENVPTFGIVVYEDLYDGIDLHTYGRRSNLKYEFHVAPGADWRQIRIRYDGIAGLSLAKDGSLIVDVADGWGSLQDDAPIIYQMIGGKKVNLPGRFVILDEKTYSFEITGSVDPGEALVIDPELAWSTYLGGSDGDSSYAVATDAFGNVHVIGWTGSYGWVFGGFDTSLEGSFSPDAFVAKLSPSGEHVWSTYMGGTESDYGFGVAVDGLGNVITTGRTESNWVSDGFDTSRNGLQDAFVAKLSPLGEHLWSTYVGGIANDTARGVTVDASNDIVVTGETCSAGWVSGGFDEGFGGDSDAFVAKLGSSGNFLWSTYLGGERVDYGQGVAVDAFGNVVVTGRTDSGGWASGGFDTTRNGGEDAFVAKLGPSGQHLWSSYLGGDNHDYGWGVATDPAGAIVIAGDTQSPDWASGGFDASFGGESDAFVAKITSAGAYLWSTYLGGSRNDYGRGVVVSASGIIAVTGYTWSDYWVSGGFDTGYSGYHSEAFVAKLSATGRHLWSSYLGGSSNDSGTGMAIIAGDLVLTGTTSSSGWIPGSSYGGGGSDGFVAKVADRALVVDSVPVTGIQVTGNRPGVTTYHALCEPDDNVSLSVPNPAIISGQRYNFLRWTLDGQPAPAGTTLTVTMDSDHTAVAEYELQTYTLTIQSSPTPGISITGDLPGTTNYTATCEDQQSVTLAAPATASVSGAGYSFLRWSLDGVDQAYGERNLQILMNANHTAVSFWRLAGDVTGDCRVNVLDLITARNRLLLNPEDPANLDAIRQADVNGDGTVSILDMIFTRNRLGAACP